MTHWSQTLNPFESTNRASFIKWRVEFSQSGSTPETSTDADCEEESSPVSDLIATLVASWCEPRLGECAILIKREI